jgi:hypothetical protein
VLYIFLFTKLSIILNTFRSLMKMSRIISHHHHQSWLTYLYERILDDEIKGTNPPPKNTQKIEYNHKWDTKMTDF